MNKSRMNFKSKYNLRERVYFKDKHGNLTSGSIISIHCSANCIEDGKYVCYQVAGYDADIDPLDQPYIGQSRLFSTQEEALRF